MDPDKIEAFKNCPTPKNVTEVTSFMGLTGHYERFIGGFSKVAHGINSLKRKGIKFEWTSKCEEIFQWLKYFLTSAPILKVADPEKDFVVCIDTCKQGLGGVLMQDNHVVFYESKKLKEIQRNYATHDLELAAIVHALKVLRHYLMGIKFELRIDQCGLKYLFDHTTLNARKSRWMEFCVSLILKSNT